MAGWDNKVAVITGASRGIGAGLAKHCASLGMQVVAVATNLDKLRELEISIRSSGGSVTTVQTDVADPTAPCRHSPIKSSIVLVRSTCYSTMRGS